MTEAGKVDKMQLSCRQLRTLEVNVRVLTVYQRCINGGGVKRIRSGAGDRQPFTRSTRLDASASSPSLTKPIAITSYVLATAVNRTEHQPASHPGRNEPRREHKRAPFAMPHSTDAEARSSPAAVKDEPMEDGGAVPDDVEMAELQDDAATVAAAAEEPKKDVKLEELFDDVDSDEEFPSSAPVAQPSSPAAPAAPL